MLPLALVALSSVAVAVDAPVTAVTVYSDRARVVRSGSVVLPGGGAHKLELPLLPDSVDPSSIRVEAAGADVRRVDIAHVAAGEFPRDEARDLLREIEQADDKLARATLERDAARALLDVLHRLQPSAPGGDPLKAPPKLVAAGWPAVLGFIDAWATRLDKTVRDADDHLVDLSRDREKLLEKARILGGAGRRSGWRVSPTLAGVGGARVTLTYVVGSCRWTPSYDLQLAPDTNLVSVSFGGLVSQSTGEDWDDAQLALSTAIPASSTEVPRLATWKIGERERFVPTPSPLQESPRPPPPTVPPLAAEREDELVRGRLLARARVSAGDVVDDLRSAGRYRKQGAGEVSRNAPVAPDVDHDGIPDKEDRMAVPEAPPPPPPPRPSYASTPVRAMESMPGAAPAAPMAQRYSSADIQTESVVATGRSSSGEYVPTQGVGLAPPPGWTPPSYAPDLPVSLAGGYDLVFSSLVRETIKSGKGARRVALFSESWPVSVERRLFPALAPHAYLVAAIRNPSKRVLPGGPANLFVGADPAGVAQLKLVAPGEMLTLPLGLDRAFKPIRNVKQNTVEKGVFSKDEITEYEVTLEIANPYRTAIALRVFDQWPVTGDKNLEVKLTRVAPGAKQDPVKGSLEWQVNLAPSSKTTLIFNYTLRRPKGYRLHQ